MNPKHYVYYVIASQPRSGTHWVMGGLQNHPECRCYGEILNPASGNKPFPMQTRGRDILDRYIWPNNQIEWKAVGFAVHPSQCQSVFPNNLEVWSEIVKRPSIRILRLTRRNRLAQFTSALRANKTKRWQKYHDDERTEKVGVEVRPDQLEKFCRQKDAEETFYNVLNKDHRVFQIAYEDLRACPVKKWGHILDFLELSRFPWVTRTKRQRTEPLRDAITNYDQIARLLRNTPREQWLDD